MTVDQPPGPRNTVAADTVGPTLDHRALWCLREACRRCFEKQEAAARAFGVSPPHFSRQLNGLVPFPLACLARVPEVAIEFAALFAKATGHRLAHRGTVAARRRRQAMRLQVLELTRLALEDEADDDDGGGASLFA